MEDSSCAPERRIVLTAKGLENIMERNKGYGEVGRAFRN